MSDTKWTPAQIPDQSGRRVIVTGGNSGIGYYAALELARKGASVVLTARDAKKGDEARSRILAEVPAAKVEVGSLDLASLDSVCAFAGKEAGKPLDILINNAGVMAPPKRQEADRGMELQFGTNVVGHFALTARLFPTLTPSSRVVWLASIAHKQGKINFDDLQSREHYSPMGAYQQSKLADLMLAFEMDRRLRRRNSKILSVAAHPGVANTNLFQAHQYSWLETKMRHAASGLIGALLNTQAEGALPTEYAATAPQVEGGGYYGPQGFLEMRGGDVGPAKVSAQARDIAAAEQLWKICEEVGGVELL
ncbi:oxidoreductase [Granulicella sibirica]|uniref:Short chain dehydrogenase n=1 Tax=Granulicella sibirica TaxID=2479048 RepID=A0A4Q0T9C8_9BACT|nr:oxidoreductase [Granulicella sibirica]RXH58649.1 short chain dehydrogenase [Granulicella sibirica]